MLTRTACGTCLTYNDRKYLKHCLCLSHKAVNQLPGDITERRIPFPIFSTLLSACHRTYTTTIHVGAACSAANNGRRSPCAWYKRSPWVGCAGRGFGQTKRAVQCPALVSAPHNVRYRHCLRHLGVACLWCAQERKSVHPSCQWG